jgi:hypothetical protein
MLMARAVEILMKEEKLQSDEESVLGTLNEAHDLVRGQKAKSRDRHEDRNVAIGNPEPGRILGSG